MKAFFIRWVVTTIAVLAADKLVHGISHDHWRALLAASLLLGLANAFLKPFLMLLSLPLLVFTFGLFTLVINTVLLFFVGKLVDGFHIADWWSAFWGALIISIVTILLKNFQFKTHVSVRGVRSEPQRPKDKGTGRVIDV